MKHESGTRIQSAPASDCSTSADRGQGSAREALGGIVMDPLGMPVQLIDAATAQRLCLVLFHQRNEATIVCHCRVLIDLPQSPMLGIRNFVLTTHLVTKLADVPCCGSVRGVGAIEVCAEA